MKAMEALQTISVGTKLAGRKQEVTRSLKHGETQESKQRQEVHLLSLQAANSLKKGVPDWHCPANYMPSVHA